MPPNLSDSVTACAASTGFLLRLKSEIGAPSSGCLSTASLGVCSGRQEYSVNAQPSALLVTGTICLWLFKPSYHFEVFKQNPNASHSHPSFTDWLFALQRETQCSLDWSNEPALKSVLTRGSGKKPVWNRCIFHSKKDFCLGLAVCILTVSVLLAHSSDRSHVLLTSRSLSKSLYCYGLEISFSPFLFSNQRGRRPYGDSRESWSCGTNNSGEPECAKL